MLERLKHAQIAHNRGDQCVVGQHAPLAHGQRQDCHDLIPVHVHAVGVHGKTAVRVAVQSDATVRPRLDYGCLELLQMSGTVTVVDVQAVMRQKELTIGVDRLRRS